MRTLDVTITILNVVRDNDRDRDGGYMVLLNVLHIKIDSVEEFTFI